MASFEDYLDSVERASWTRTEIEQVTDFQEYSWRACGSFSRIFFFLRGLKDSRVSPSKFYLNHTERILRVRFIRQRCVVGWWIYPTYTVEALADIITEGLTDACVYIVTFDPNSWCWNDRSEMHSVFFSTSKAVKQCAVCSAMCVF
jgi:hypothetical protein